MADELILYKWQPSRGIDAPNPRGVALNRLLVLANISYTVRIVTPGSLEGGQVKVEDLVSRLPVIEYKGKKSSGITKILSVLTEEVLSEDSEAIRLSFEPENIILTYWGLDHLFNVAAYARFVKAGNFARYVELAVQSLGIPELPKKFQLIQEVMRHGIAGTALSNCTESDFEKIFQRDMKGLVSHLKRHGGTFTSGGKISFTDLVIFGCVQSLLAPDIEERTWIKKNTPEIVEWARRVHELTRGEWTRSLIDL
jgi:hypothetical protein